MTLVVNASPLICLAKAGLLDLLERLDPEVLVPEPVASEVLAGPPGDPARVALEGGWGFRRPGSHVPHRVLEWGLGAGESSVLALALETASATAVLDDREARVCARLLGVTVVGSLGLVLRAAREGLIPAAAPALQALRGSGIHLDDATIREALARTTGESW